MLMLDCDERIRTALKSSTMFFGLEDGHLDGVASIAELQDLPEKRIIYTQHSPSKGLYIVVSGQVKVFRLSPDGKEYIIHVVGSGETFAEAATLGQFACPASAATMEPCTLVFLPAERFLRILESDSAMCIQVLKGMATWQCRLMGALENIVLRDSVGRLASYLLSLTDDYSQTPAKVRLPIKKRDVAAYLALTPETLSRTFGKLVELDAIRHDDDGKIELTLPATLKELANV